MSEDQNIISHIDELIAEEHQLRSHAPGGGLTDQERQRLGALGEQLDQCWDLLRQRRAKAEFHENPDEATARSTNEVESYLQ